MEWQWTGFIAKKLEKSFQIIDWESIASTLIEVMGKFEDIKVSDRHRMGKPWVGALKIYQENR
jgi:hypothetical protein